MSMENKCLLKYEKRWMGLFINTEILSYLLNDICLLFNSESLRECINESFKNGES